MNPSTLTRFFLPVLLFVPNKRQWKYHQNKSAKNNDIRKSFLLLLFFFVGTSTAFSQTNRLSFNDTRSLNYPPDSFSFETRYDFKYRSILGVPGSGEFSGLMTVAPWSDATGGNIYQLNFNTGGLFLRQGIHGGNWQAWSKLLTSAGTQVVEGNLHIQTDNDVPITFTNTEANSWQYVQYMSSAGGRLAYMGISPGNDFYLVKEGGGNIILDGGNVGIGTNNPGDSRLAVNGTIAAKKVKVTLQNWPDHVFTNSYPLPSLYQVEKYIKTHQHLPEVPAEKEAVTNGIELGEMNKILLQKVEELTLYLIEHRKELDALKADNKDLRRELKQLKK